MSAFTFDSEMSLDTIEGIRERLHDDLRGIFKKVFVDGVHIATMLKEDYDGYRYVYKETPEDAAKRFVSGLSSDGNILNGLEIIKERYPEEDAAMVVGYQIVYRRKNGGKQKVST